MTRTRWLLVWGIALVVVIVVAALLGRGPTGGGGVPVAVTDPTTSTTGAPTASPQATAEATATPDPTAEPTPTPDPTPTPEPTPEPTPTDPPLARGDAATLYATFLLRVNDDRATVGRLNDALSAAAQAQDPKGVHDASVDILDFVDRERDWLRDHPPAACYAKAHKAARAMVAAYGDAAERFLDWSATGGGLAGLGALGKAVDAANVAGDRLTAFGAALEATRCPA